MSINSLSSSEKQKCNSIDLFAVDGRVPRGVKNPLCFSMAERFQQARSSSGLSLIQVAMAAGVAQPIPGRFERGEAFSALDTVERMACAVGVSPGWLAYGYEGTEPYRERYPRPIVAPSDPIPDEALRTFQARYAGFPERLRLSRARSGLSMRALSTAAGVSVQTWSIAESGKVAPRVDTAERMAVALGVAPSWLAFGEGVMN